MSQAPFSAARVGVWGEWFPRGNARAPFYQIVQLQQPYKLYDARIWVLYRIDDRSRWLEAEIGRWEGGAKEDVMELASDAAQYDWSILCGLGQFGPRGG